MKVKHVVKLVVNYNVGLRHVLWLIPKVSVTSRFVVVVAKTFLDAAPLLFVFVILLILIFLFLFLLVHLVLRLLLACLKLSHSDAFLDIPKSHMVAILSVLVEVLHEVMLEILL